MTSCNIFRFLSLALLLLLAVSTVEAQEEGGKRRRRAHDNQEAPTHPRLKISAEVGLNATTLIDKVFRASFDSANANPYLLTARIGYKNFGLRLGGGGSYQVTQTFQTGFRDSDTRTIKGWDTRLGIDYRTKLARRWTANFALDAIGNYSLNKRLTDSGFDAIEQIEQFSGWGGGLSIGLSYWINAHIGIMTEANFYFLSGTRESARRFKNFPELDDNLVNQNIESLRKMLPSSIFIVYKF